jgi:hypothetical protein
LAWDRIGLGGLPSPHAAVVSSTAARMGLSEGVHTPFLSIAVTLGVLVMLDAMHLRRAVGAHAAARNDVLQGDPRGRPFQARVGHRQVEVLMGLLGGIGGACV